MSATETPEPLTADQAQRLAEFARACKAAARAVALYPSTHPTIRSGLQRVGDSAERLRADTNATVTVVPDGMLLEGRAAAKPDGAIAELAVLLHSHLIGELTILGALTPEAWHAFLSLLARPPQDIQSQGGIGRAWMAVGGGPIEIRQIDYSEVLRERSGGLAADWDRLIANYLEGELSDLDDDAMGALLEIAGDQNRFKEFTEQLVTQASEGGRRGKKEIVLRVLQALADFVARTNPAELDRILRQIAGVVPQLTPDLVVTLITTGVPVPEGTTPPGIDLPGEVRARISDETIAQFVAQSVSRDQGATGRLAQAFQALVPEPERRGELLEMAQQELSELPLGRQPGFPDLWKSAESLLTSYSDSSFVSDDYARELSTARTHAIEVERVSDDPPERVSAWLATVGATEVHQLDQQLLLDLLRIDTREDAWRKVADTAIEHIEQMVLVGNLAFAQQMLDAIVAAAEEGQPFTNSATIALERLRKGPGMKHVVLFIRQAKENELAAISTFCRTLGPSVIGRLAWALANEQSSAIVKRLREVLLSFGAAGRQYADELRNSANPAVRRTAIELLRAFGGADALPDLTALLDDTEPAVQREALRAIVQIGTDEAYAALGQALKSSSATTREAIMRVLGSARDERAAPLFIYIIEHTEFRGSLESIYMSAIEALGKTGGDAKSVEALRKVLYRDEWWRPFRTTRMREAAARALRMMVSDAAKQALDEAASSGSRAVRRVARAALAIPAPAAPVVKDAAVAKDAPVAKGAGVASEPPVGREVPVASEAPVAQDVAVAGEAPVGYEAPVAKDTPVASDAPVVTDTPVPSDVPVVEDTALANDAAVANDAPVTNEAPVANEAPVTDDAAVPKDAPIAKDT